MQKQLTILLLSMLTVTAYANNKARPNKVKQPVVKDSSAHSPSKGNPYGTRMYDPRLGRYMHLTPK